MLSYPYAGDSDSESDVSSKPQLVDIDLDLTAFVMFDFDCFPVAMILIF